MAAYYPDTSAAVTRYIQEAGTIWIRQITDPAAANEVITIALTGPELIAALTRLARAGQPRSATAFNAITVAEHDWRNL